MLNWKQHIKRAAELKQNRSWNETAELLSQELGVEIHPERLRGALRRANVEVVDSVPQNLQAAVEAPVIAVEHPRRDADIVTEIVFGALGDSHLCSNYERLDILHQLYDVFEARGVKQVFHTGNYIDGEATFNVQDIHVHGVDAQCQYFVDNYPKRDGITTLYIDGNDHEGWYTKKLGLLTGQHVEDMARRSGRDDLVFLGYMEANVSLFEDGPVVKVCHPGGGSAYALSYTSQKIIDSYEDYEKPDILLIGHYHKASLLPNYRGVTIIQTGCTEEATPFMRSKRLHADLGGWIVTLGINQYNKIARINTEFVTFPMNPWKYR